MGIVGLLGMVVCRASRRGCSYGLSLRRGEMGRGVVCRGLGVGIGCAVGRAGRGIARAGIPAGYAGAKTACAAFLRPRIAVISRHNLAPKGCLRREASPKM